jgi:dipeptidyl aminopeptidase/acylaminoacyl peptidase
LATGHIQVLAGAEVSLDPAWVSVPQPIDFLSQDGLTAYGWYYPPTNPDVTGPAEVRPPVLVQPHPGPTADAKARLDLRTQFFTSRGFGVVEVNYAGSTGYGRAYRERLTGQWGVLDVADCLDAARSLVRAGEVDGRRLLISGASAGGFTALCALAFHDLVAAGTSAYGIADLETFREQAPKFQAHELDRLVGPYPQAVVTYRARSPVHAAERITSPVLLLQGLDDKIVPPTQTQLMAEALSRTGIPHRYLTFQGEGHGLRRPSSIKQALKAELSLYLDAMTYAPTIGQPSNADEPNRTPPA